MKWLPPYGMVQMSSCGRYTVQHPTDQFIAYSIPTCGNPQKLGERDTVEKARGLCMDHEAHLRSKAL